MPTKKARWKKREFLNAIRPHDIYDIAKFLALSPSQIQYFWEKEPTVWQIKELSKNLPGIDWGSLIREI